MNMDKQRIKQESYLNRLAGKIGKTIPLEPGRLIEWSGNQSGNCPFPHGVKLTVHHRDGDMITGVTPFTEATRWNHSKKWSGGDIVRYQVHKYG